MLALFFPSAVQLRIPSSFNTSLVPLPHQGWRAVNNCIDFFPFDTFLNMPSSQDVVCVQTPTIVRTMQLGANKRHSPLCHTVTTLNKVGGVYPSLKAFSFTQNCAVMEAISIIVKVVGPATSMKGPGSLFFIRRHRLLSDIAAQIRKRMRCYVETWR